MAAFMRRVHGDGGVFYAGSWVPLEQLGQEWCPPSQAWSGDARQEPRAAATGPSFDADVAIIGAGCIGAAVARELSRFNLGVTLIDAGEDVSQGATKGNSGIVHAGFDDAPGSRRAQFCPAGNRMFSQLDRELRFGLQRNGSLVVARGDADEATLRELLSRGITNGVNNMRIIGRDELRALEPEIARDATAALLAPDAATLVPYEYTIALVENAVDNGVALRLRTRVTGITALPGGGFELALATAAPPGGHRHHRHHSDRPTAFLTGGAAAATLAAALAVYAALNYRSAVDAEALPLAAVGLAAAALVASAAAAAWALLGRGGRAAAAAAPAPRLRARYVVNAAGCASDAIARLAGDDSFRIKPRLGEYLLLRKEEGARARHVLFPAPGPLGKGVLVQTTLWGNLILDPATAKRSRADIMEAILTKCRELVPGFDASQVIHSFSGARAKSSRGDWIIERCAAAPDLVHAAGIDSPGLAGSPAIALEVLRLLREAGLDTPPNAAFNPHRRPLIVPKEHGAKPRAALIAADGSVRTEPIKTDGPDAAHNVVCRCERVTEAEIVDALRRSLPCDGTQAVRRRTRAGMGHCQGEFCEKRVCALVARERGVAPEHVERRPWPASSVLPKRWMDETDIEDLLKCSGGATPAAAAAAATR